VPLSVDYQRRGTRKSLELNAFGFLSDKAEVSGEIFNPRRQKEEYTSDLF
jgi:hypothetical protein